MSNLTLEVGIYIYIYTNSVTERFNKSIEEMFKKVLEKNLDTVYHRR